MVSVKEQFGCSSVFSAPFKVVNANGGNGPDAASNLIAIPLSNTQVELDWANNQYATFNETAFEIYRSTSQGSSYAFIGSVPADTITYVDATALPNISYYYIVRAVNNNAAALLSNEANATTFSDRTPPSAPANLHVVSTTNTSATLVWDAATDNVGIDRYDVYINGIKSYSTDKLNILVNGLDKGKQYVFFVKAKDLSDNYSTQSSQVSAFSALQGLQYKYYEGSWSVLPDFNTLTPVKTGFTSNIDISVRTATINLVLFGKGISKYLWQVHIRLKLILMMAVNCGWRLIMPQQRLSLTMMDCMLHSLSPERSRYNQVFILFLLHFLNRVAEKLWNCIGHARNYSAMPTGIRLLIISLPIILHLPGVAFGAYKYYGNSA
jgi:hypothetical protein